MLLLTHLWDIADTEGIDFILNVYLVAAQLVLYLFLLVLLQLLYIIELIDENVPAEILFVLPFLIYYFTIELIFKLTNS